MPGTVIDGFYDETRQILEYLDEQNQVSMRASLVRDFQKALVLAAASFFEDQFKRMITDFVERHTNRNQLIVSLVRNKAIERQYHTFFDWDKRNANRFYAVFGKDFRDYMSEEVAKDEELDSAVKAFLEIGALRNQLVHQNFVMFNIEKTVEELYELYTAAERFLTLFSDKLEEHLTMEPQDEDESLDL